MGGRSHLTFLDLPDETYIITMPNMYAVGLFVGTLTMELADSCTVTCQKNDLIAEIDFKFKVRREPRHAGHRASLADGLT